MTLPVRLEAGDPAPETGVLVPLHGPNDDYPVVNWHTISSILREEEWGATADSFTAIADAAAAPQPLRKGDRVRVGQLTATVDKCGDDIVFIAFDANAQKVRVHSWLPVEAVTRIDEGDET